MPETAWFLAKERFKRGKHNGVVVDHVMDRFDQYMGGVRMVGEPERTLVGFELTKTMKITDIRDQISGQCSLGDIWGLMTLQPTASEKGVLAFGENLFFVRGIGGGVYTVILHAHYCSGWGLHAIPYNTECEGMWGATKYHKGTRVFTPW